jgi:hypothetical protein
MSSNATFITDYFSGERAESMLFIAVGIAAVAFACWSVFAWKDAIWKGFAIGLIGVGLIQMVVGGTVASRAPAQIANMQTALAQPAKRAEIVKNERARIEKVQKDFVSYRWLEIGFIVVGLAITLALRAKGFWLGLGAGLLIQGAVMYTFDVFAETRAQAYAEHLRTL